MALSRLIYRGFQPYRSGLAPLTSVDGLRRGGRLSQVPARTLFGRDRERQTKSQSRVLSASEGKLKSIFELQVHHVKPDCMEEYLRQSGEHMIHASENPEIPVKLLGSWTTIIGAQLDQATHIWQYTGYDKVSETAEKLNNAKHWNEFAKARNKMITSRSNQIILPFVFWDPANAEEKREPKGIYEMRSYKLQPGTLIEWGQNWEQGIKYRKEESIGGWFSQIGELHQVFHLWAYKDLHDRTETRQAAWEFPGWDECVVRTVPLIRSMEARIMVPAPYSPLK